MTDANNDTYTNKYVLFLDILGFKSKVETSRNNPICAKEIHDVLADMQKRVEKQFEGVDDFQLTLFSDSLYLTAPFDDGVKNNLIWFLETASLTINSLLFHDFYTRGAITAGECFHRGPLCYGPAVVDAYELEEHVANWPRVIVDDAAIGLNIVQQDNDAEALNALLQEDGHRFYLDSLSNFDDYDSKDEYKDLLQAVCTHTESNLRNNTNEHVRSKYEAFAEYFNSSIDRIQSMGQLPRGVNKIDRKHIHPSDDRFLTTLAALHERLGTPR
jgi:hypothetical protein